MSRYIFVESSLHFAFQVLESAGVIKKIKRIAGASAGAITATLIAIGYNSQELKDFLDQDLRKILVGMYLTLFIDDDIYLTLFIDNNDDILQCSYVKSKSIIL